MTLATTIDWGAVPEEHRPIRMQMKMDVGYGPVICEVEYRHYWPYGHSAPVIESPREWVVLIPTHDNSCAVASHGDLVIALDRAKRLAMRRHRGDGGPL